MGMSKGTWPRGSRCWGDIKLQRRLYWSRLNRRPDEAGIFVYTWYAVNITITILGAKWWWRWGCWWWWWCCCCWYGGYIHSFTSRILQPILCKVYGCMNFIWQTRGCQTNKASPSPNWIPIFQSSMSCWTKTPASSPGMHQIRCHLSSIGLPLVGDCSFAEQKNTWMGKNGGVMERTFPYPVLGSWEMLVVTPKFDSCMYWILYMHGNY